MATTSFFQNAHNRWRGLPPDGIFPERVAKGSRFTFGGLGVDMCWCDPASGVRNRPRTTVVRIKLPCL